jgi:hypothetical protein
MKTSHGCAYRLAMRGKTFMNQFNQMEAYFEGLPAKPTLARSKTGVSLFDATPCLA